MPITGNDPLNLLKPEAGELVSLSVINTNYDTINTYADGNDTRSTAIEAKNTEQDGRLTALEAEDVSLDGRLSTVEGQLEALEPFIVTTVTGTTRTLIASDAGDALRFTSATEVTFTIADVFNVGDVVNIIQDGAGKVVFVAGAGVTLESPLGFDRTFTQYGWTTLAKVAAGQYRLVGNLSST